MKTAAAFRQRTGNHNREPPGRTFISGQAYSKIQGPFHSSSSAPEATPRSAFPIPQAGFARSWAKRAAIGPSHRGESTATRRLGGGCHENETARPTFRTALVVTEVESFASLVEGGRRPALRRHESGVLGCGPIR